MRSDGRGRGELSGVRSWPEQPALRQRIAQAVVELVGEGGLRNLTLGQVLKRAETNNRAFHRHFDSVEDAVIKVYEERARALVADLLKVGLSAEDWQSGLRAAVKRLIGWTAQEPSAARFLLVEYRSLPRTFELHERGAAQLAEAIDLARREIEPSRQPPTMSADLVIGGIESQLASRLRAGREDQLEELSPMVCYIVVLLYRGRKAALQELN
jgi:AcrR family transcriptional regulator